MFLPYIHVERLGTEETEGILNGEVEVTPKMDGTNACIWWDNGMHAASRKREIVTQRDNAGFARWIFDDSPTVRVLREICKEKPEWIIYGEWMGYDKFVGSIKDYDDEALGRFFVFDVLDTVEGKYLPRREWASLEPSLEKFAVPVLGVLSNPTEEDVLAVAEQNRYMLEHANHNGEGVVLRNDSFVNRFGRQARAKVVLDEYKQNKRASKRRAVDGGIEQSIVSAFVTDAEMAKAKAKTETYFNEAFSTSQGKMVGYYLNIVVRDCLWDECANWVKKFKPKSVDFGALQCLAQDKARKYIGL